MIGRISSGADLQSLLRYVRGEKNAYEERLGRPAVADPGQRVRWVQTRNTLAEIGTAPDAGWEAIEVEMTDTARCNNRVRQPAYHLVLGFAPSDAADDELQTRVADEVLRGMGLDGHQAVIVSHGDSRTPHVHIVVNRVHPTTHRAWNRYRDRYRLRETLMAIEREQGLHKTPRQAGATGLAAHIREAAAEDLLRARSWTGIDRVLSTRFFEGGELPAPHGRVALIVDTKGRGSAYRPVNADVVLKERSGMPDVPPSRVAPRLGRGRLQRVFGRALTDHAAARKRVIGLYREAVRTAGPDRLRHRDGKAAQKAVSWRASMPATYAAWADMELSAAHVSAVRAGVQAYRRAQRNIERDAGRGRGRAR